LSISDLKEYESPASVQEASEILKRYEDAALVVAGGTFIHGLSARGLLFGIDALVDITNLPLGEITEMDDRLVIGANVTYEKLASSNVILSQPSLGAISDAMRYPPPQIMNAATVGGCVAASCPLFDLPTALAALDVVVIGSDGIGAESQNSLLEFQRGLFENILGTGELLTSLSIPASFDGRASGFSKF